MFGSGCFGDKLPSWFLKMLKVTSFYSGNFNIFKDALRQFIPNCPPKHVIIITNLFKFRLMTFLYFSMKLVTLLMMMGYDRFYDFMASWRFLLTTVIQCFKSCGNFLDRLSFWKLLRSFFCTQNHHIMNIR